MANVLEITKENFEAEVLKSPLPVLVDFWGPRCAPCLGLLPVVDELAQIYEDKIKFCKVNITENRRLAIELKVMSLPTFLFYKNGQVVSQLQTSFGRPEIEEQLKSLLS